MRRSGPAFDCILAVAVGLAVAVALTMLPKPWQLSASVLLAWGIFAAGVGLKFRPHRR